MKSENPHSTSDDAKEAAVHTEEPSVEVPVDEEGVAIEQQPSTEGLHAEAETAAVLVEANASPAGPVSRHHSPLETATAGEEDAVNEPVGELSTAVPSEDHAVAVPLDAHASAAAPAHEVREADTEAGPRDEVPKASDGSGTAGQQAPLSAAAEVTGSAAASTPELPSPVPQPSAGARTPPPQLPQQSRPSQSQPEPPKSPAEHRTTTPQQSLREAEPRGVSMKAAVDRSMEVYADAGHNTTAYRFDVVPVTDASLAGQTYSSSVPGVRAGSRAGSYVQTPSGFGVLTDFQRGSDNSHTNRMVDGSYSRYLEATRHVPEPEVFPSFYGNQPLSGTAPASLMNTQHAMDEARLSQRFRVSQPGMSTAASLGSGFANTTGGSGQVGGLDESWSARSRGLPHQGIYAAQPHASNRTAEELAEWGMIKSQTFPAINRKQRVLGGTVSSSVLRRELDLLEPEINQELAEQRALRRRAPTHCKPVRQERDFVYYNHRSKGLHVPHDLPPDTIMLNYNHTFDFGMGTRFSTGERPARRNPGAQGPMLYSEMTRGSRSWQTRTHPSLYGSSSAHARTFDGTCGAETTTSPALKASARHKTREQIATQSHSLRTAHAIRTDELHTSQFRRTRTIEDVMAQSPAYMASRTVDGTQVAVSPRKVSAQEIPNQLRTAVDIAASHYGRSGPETEMRGGGADASARPLSQSPDGQRERTSPRRPSPRGGRLLNGTLHGGLNTHRSGSPSPGASARTATPGVRFTDKPTKDLIGVMGAAAGTATPPARAHGAAFDVSELAARRQRQLNQPSAPLASTEGNAMPTLTGASHTP